MENDGSVIFLVTAHSLLALLLWLEKLLFPALDAAFVSDSFSVLVRSGGLSVLLPFVGLVLPTHHRSRWLLVGGSTCRLCFGGS